MTIRSERYKDAGVAFDIYGDDGIRERAIMEKRDFQHLVKNLQEIEDYLFFVADFIPHNERAKRLEMKAREMRKLFSIPAEATDIKVEGYGKKDKSV